MNHRSQSPRRVTPVHALAAIAVAAVGWYCCGQAVRGFTAAFAGSRTDSVGCMYQVVINGRCCGAVFFREPQSARAVLTALGEQSVKIDGLNAVIRCDRTLSIDTEAGSVEVDTIRGAGLLAAGRRIDINVASARDLEAVPGIGPKLAARIVETRDMRGAFASVERLRDIPGIGRKRLSQLAPFLDAGPVTRHPRGEAPPVCLVSP